MGFKYLDENIMGYKGQEVDTKMDKTSNKPLASGAVYDYLSGRISDFGYIEPSTAPRTVSVKFNKTFESTPMVFVGTYTNVATCFGANAWVVNGSITSGGFNLAMSKGNDGGSFVMGAWWLAVEQR